MKGSQLPEPGPEHSRTHCVGDQKATAVSLQCRYWSPVGSLNATTLREGISPESASHGDPVKKKVTKYFDRGGQRKSFLIKNKWTWPFPNGEIEGECFTRMKGLASVSWVASRRQCNNLSERFCPFDAGIIHQNQQNAAWIAKQRPGVLQLLWLWRMLLWRQFKDDWAFISLAESKSPLCRLI